MTAVTALDHAESIRAEAMGDAVTAVGADPTLFWHSPAALGRIKASTLTLAGFRDPFADTTGQAVFAGPFSTGVIAFGFLYDDAGSTNVTTSAGETVSLRLQQDLLGAIALALPLTDQLTGGLTVKALESRLFDSVTASTLALDAGCQAALTDFLRAGLVVQNAGGGLHYAGDEAAIPLVWRAGLAAGFAPAPNALIIATVDGYQSTSIGETGVAFGAEFIVQRMISVRAGAKFTNREEVTNLSAGAGLKRGAFRLDYALRFAHDTFENPNALSLTYTF